VQEGQKQGLQRLLCLHCLLPCSRLL
jgi:hypothetical protein